MAARRVHFLLRRSLDLTFYRSRQPLLKNLNIRLLSDQIVDRLGSEPPIPEYKSPQNEPLDRRRARLLYQSRWEDINLLTLQLIGCWPNLFFQTEANCKLIYSVFISLQEAWNVGKWIIVEVGCYITVELLIELDWPLSAAKCADCRAESLSRNKNVSKSYYLIPVLFQNEWKINTGHLVELNSKELCLVTWL